MKNSYILNEKHVGHFATIVTLQEGNVTFTKDGHSKLYIAEVEGEVEIPESARALKMELPEPETTEAPIALMPNFPGMDEPDQNSVDLLIRLKMNSKPNPESMPGIYEKIARAIESAMDDMNDKPESN